MKRLCLLLLTLVLTALYSPILRAQNNAFKIDDGVYEYYQKVTKKIRMPEGLLMIDTLFQKAVEAKDVKAQCIAKYCKVQWYAYNHTKNVELVKEKLQEAYNFIIDKPYTQYLFSSWNLYLSVLAATRDYVSMARELEKYQRLALKLDNTYGLSRSYVRQGDLYTDMGQIRLARDCYQKGLNVALDRNELQDVSYNYYRLGECDANLGDTALALQYYDKSLETSKIDAQRGFAVQGLADIYVKKEDPRAEQYMKEFKRLIDEKVITSDILVSRYYYLRMIQCVNQKDINQAVALLPEVTALPYSRYARRLIFQTRGQLDSLYNDYKRSFASLDSSRHEFISYQYDVFQVNFGKSVLENEQEGLKLKNLNASLALQQLNARHLMEQSHQDSLQMSANRSKLQAEALQTRLSKERLAMSRQAVKRAKDEAQRAQKWRSGIMWTLHLVGLLLIASVLYLYLRRRRVIRARQQAIELQQEAEQADMKKQKFLEQMNHEIRTPLNSIVGYTDILNVAQDYGLSDDERREMQKSIHEQSRELQQLIDKILDMSKLESGTYKFRSDKVQLAKVCDDVATDFRPLAHPGVQLQIRVPADMPTLICDKYRMEQILQGLLSNAVNNTQQGSIVLEARHEMRKGRCLVTMTCTDTGSGIPQGEEEKIFNRFYKLDPFSTGFGLGLSILRLSLELRGGDIHVDTSYHQGARFILHIYFDVA